MVEKKNLKGPVTLEFDGAEMLVPETLKRAQRILSLMRTKRISITIAHNRRANCR